MKKILLIFLFAFGISNIVNAQTPRVQALYIYNLARYMQWPAESREGDFIIGVYTNDPILSELQKIARTKLYLDQQIVIKVFNSVESITNCHVLYIPTKATAQIKTIVKKIWRYKTLIIANSPNAIKYGAGINFVSGASGKLEFEVKSVNIVKRGIKVSVKIEELAIKKYS